MADPPSTARGIVVAAPASHSGKTTLVLGLLCALARRGRAVASFKVGPDFIDPGLHAAATGRPSFNLDSWAMRVETLAGLCDRAATDADLVVGEGVMGLFDGAADGTGSTADVAVLLGLPVVLVVDAAGMGASAAALVDGFVRFREDVDVAAVVFNRVGSPRHADLLRRACDERFSQPVLGCLPPRPELMLPERHLGLVPADEQAGLAATIERLADLVTAEIDLEWLERLARPPALAAFGPPPMPLPPLGQHIAVARDDAFAFAYEAVLDGWHASGAEVLPFAPLADEAPDPSADAVYLPGGYPELHAARLAEAARFRDGMLAAVERGVFVYGECGGFMALGDALIDADGNAHAQLGLLPLVTSFAERRLQLGYRRARLRRDCPLGSTGAAFRGHEFHYATVVSSGPAPALFELADATGAPLGANGLVVGRVAASFVHLIDREAPG